MMPWRDQLRLGWKILRWLYWPEGNPWWYTITGWIAAVIIAVGLTLDVLWPIGIATGLVIASAVIRVRNDQRRSR